MTDADQHADLAPFTLFETSPQSSSLILSDDHMLALSDVFAEHDHEGGGYDWDTVARTALRLQAPHLEGRVKFDPEAGMFCAYGPDQAALRELGEVLVGVYRDRASLAELIAAADPGDWD